MALKRICLAGGCFWGTELYMRRIPGIIFTVVGYANSEIENPTYEQVCSGGTHAAEAVMIDYDPETISLELLLKAFSRTVDPTSLNKQGNDIGTQYRTGIYWEESDSEAKEAVESFLSSLAGKYEKPIVVEALPLKTFYPAEAYHQRYLEKNPEGYCHVDVRDAQHFVNEHMSQHI